MKYIRTKDGRIIDCVKLMKEAEEHTLQNEDDYKLASVIALQSYDTILGWQRRVEKSADTIEELCDEFVVKYGDGSYCLTQRLKHAEMEEHNANLNGIGGHVYGAVWTDKGLTFVAKMNEKGELELL